MGLHGRCIGVRHDDRRAFIARRADRAEEIGVGVTLILGLARPGPLPGP
jgi:hypothetical protein